MTENEKYVHDAFMNSIKSGFNSLEDIIDEAVDMVEEEGWEIEITEDWIRENATREYEKHEKESKSWQLPTDCDKLLNVFDKLCKEKIVALHCAGYTQEDALYDVQEVREDLEDMGVHPIGYCYYHQQDMERAINQGVLMISFYGKKEKNDKEAIMVGNIIVNALKEAGFTVNWDNTTSKRIEVSPFIWHNAFTSVEEVEDKWGYDRVIRLMGE